MNESSVAEIVATTLTHFDGNRYDLAAWCVMPNHVHAIVRPRDGHDLHKILHSWKSYSAQQINRLLQRSGQFWQSEYYDHIIRDEDEFYRCI